MTVNIMYQNHNIKTNLTMTSQHSKLSNASVTTMAQVCGNLSVGTTENKAVHRPSTGMTISVQLK